MAKANVEAYSYKRYTATGNNQVFTGDCILGGINLNSGTSVTVALYDGTGTNSPQVIGTFTLSAGWNRLPFAFSTGMFLVIGGTSPDITLAWMA